MIRFGHYIHYMMYLMANKCHITAVRRISAHENSRTQQTKTEAVQWQERMGLLSHSVCDHEKLRIQMLCNELWTLFKECRAFALS